MKFLADHCVYGKTIRLLREQGHDVLILKELGKETSLDEIVLELAQKESAVLITCDREFGSILLYPPERYNGIVPTNHRFTGACLIFCKIKLTPRCTVNSWWLTRTMYANVDNGSVHSRSSPFQPFPAFWNLCCYHSQCRSIFVFIATTSYLSIERSIYGNSQSIRGTAF